MIGLSREWVAQKYRRLKCLAAQALEQRREPRVRLGPRQANLAHPVLGTLHPGRAGMQERQERARVQMPPRAFLGVVIDRQLVFAVRAGEPGAARMDNPYLHPTVFGRQLHPFHFPRGDQSQQMPVQLGVAPAPNPAADRPWNSSRTHAKPGSAVIRLLRPARR